MARFVNTTDLREKIRRRCADMGIETTDFQERTGISPRTYYRRMKHPGDITLDEFHRIAMVAHFDAAEIADIVNAVSR